MVGIFAKQLTPDLVHNVDGLGFALFLLKQLARVRLGTLREQQFFRFGRASGNRMKARTALTFSF